MLVSKYKKHMQRTLQIRASNWEKEHSGHIQTEVKKAR